MNLSGLFRAKPILVEEQSWYYLTYSWEHFLKIPLYIYILCMCIYKHTYKLSISIIASEMKFL